MSPCLHLSMFPCLHVYASMFMSPYFHVSIFMSSCLHVSGIPQTENGNGKLPFVCCKRKLKTDIFFSLVGKRYSVIDDRCFSKRAHLCWSWYVRLFLLRILCRSKINQMTEMYVHFLLEFSAQVWTVVVGTSKLLFTVQLLLEIYF